MSRKKSDSSMIGYDPLAWLEEPEVTDISPLTDEKINADTVLQNDAQTFLQSADSHEVIPEVDAAEESYLNQCLDALEAVADAEIAAAPLVSVPPAEETEMSSDESNVNVGSYLTIEHAQGLHEKLMGAVKAGTTIVIDAGDVEAVDTSGVQLLLSLQKEASEHHLALEWRRLSPVLSDALALLGLQHHFEVTA